MKKVQLKTGMWVQLRQDDSPRHIVLRGTQYGDLLANHCYTAVSLDLYDNGLNTIKTPECYIPEELRRRGEMRDYDIIGIYENKSMCDFFSLNDQIIPLWREGINYPKLSGFQKKILEKLIKFYPRCNFLCVSRSFMYYSPRNYSVEEFKDLASRESREQGEKTLVDVDRLIYEEFRPVLHEGVYSFRELLINCN